MSMQKYKEERTGSQKPQITCSPDCAITQIVVVLDVSLRLLLSSTTI